MKALLPYMILFVVLVAAAWGYANSDPITPAIVEARAEVATGPVTMQVIDQGAGMLVKWLSAAALASLLAFGFTEGMKFYRRYWFEQNTRRLRHPGAAFPAPRPVRPSVPRISRDDLLMALLGDRIRPPKMQQKQEASDDLRIDL
jgi:hypothetical protein